MVCLRHKEIGHDGPVGIMTVVDLSRFYSCAYFIGFVVTRVKSVVRMRVGSGQT